MGIIQQKRPDAPKVEVRETDYGAQFVKAATETPVEAPVVSVESESVTSDVTAEGVAVEEKPKKKSVRTKKRK